MLRGLLPLVALAISFGCTKGNDSNIDRYAMLKLAQKVDPDVKPVMAKDLNSGVRCTSLTGGYNYGEGCTGAFQVKVGIIDMICLEFETTAQAKAEALRLDQWYHRNWVFDDVTNEPVLEYFVKKAFGAVRPSLEKKAEQKEE